MNHIEALLNIADFTAWSHLPAYQCRQFPKVSAIYIAFTPPNDVLYIGRAKCLQSRWKGNAHPWLRCVAKTQVAWIAIDAEKQPEVEKLLIQHYRPLGNIQHNRRKPKKD